MPFNTSSIPSLCGWRPNPVAVARFLAAQAAPYFADRYPNLVKRAERAKTDVLLWEYARKVTGDHLPAHNQQRGTCVSHGYSSAMEYQQAFLIAGGVPHSVYAPTSHALIYGNSRDIAGILGDDDGSYGAAAAQAVLSRGNLSNDQAGDSDTDDRLAVEWGKTGVPSKFGPLALEHTVESAPLVRTPAELLAALMLGVAVPICSSQGFTLTRDRNGFCQPSGRWDHCMCVIGYRTDMDAFAILQSWGPNVPDGPLALGQPNCSFWVASRVVAHMLASQDTFAPVLKKLWSGEPTPPPPPAPAGMFITLEGTPIDGRYRLGDVTHGWRPPISTAAGQTALCDLIDRLRLLGPIALPVLNAVLDMVCPKQTSGIEGQGNPPPSTPAETPEEASSRSPG